MRLPPAGDNAGTLSADVLTVGDGFAGLYAPYSAGFRGLSSVVVDLLPEPSGHIAAMYPEKESSTWLAFLPYGVANTLEPIARPVTLVHRRDRFGAHQSTVREVLDSALEVLTDTEVAHLDGADRLETVEVRHRHTGRTRCVEAVRLTSVGFGRRPRPFNNAATVLRPSPICFPVIPPDAA